MNREVEVARAGYFADAPRVVSSTQLLIWPGNSRDLSVTNKVPARHVGNRPHLDVQNCILIFALIPVLSCKTPVSAAPGWGTSCGNSAGTSQTVLLLDKIGELKRKSTLAREKSRSHGWQGGLTLSAEAYTVAMGAPESWNGQALMSATRRPWTPYTFC